MPAGLSQPPPDLTYDEYVREQVARSLVNRGYDPGARARYLIGVLSRHLPPPARVLCVGCRNTHELDYFEAAGYAGVRGIDLHALDARIVVMDMQAMTWEGGAFDAVYSCHSLEHALDPARAAAEIRRVLRRRGLAMVEVPIQVERRKADLWDFGGPETVAELLGGGLVWSEVAEQIGAKQRVARALVRVNE